MFEEDQAEGVFQHPALGIAREVLLQVQALDPENDRFRVADFAQDFAGFAAWNCLSASRHFR